MKKKKQYRKQNEKKKIQTFCLRGMQNVFQKQAENSALTEHNESSFFSTEITIKPDIDDIKEEVNEEERVVDPVVNHNKEHKIKVEDIMMESIEIPFLIDTNNKDKDDNIKLEVKEEVKDDDPLCVQ